LSERSRARTSAASIWSVSRAPPGSRWIASRWVSTPATFLRRAERLDFRQVAAVNGARFAILDCTAPPDELRRRIKARARKGRDASEADLGVLERQLVTAEPLDRAERRHVVAVDTKRSIRYADLASRLRRA